MQFRERYAILGVIRGSRPHHFSALSSSLKRQSKVIPVL